jgi:hypothetical protein
MSQRTLRGALVGTLIFWQAVFPAVSEAGPLLDWLFHRNQTTTALYCPAPCPTACAPACPTVAQSPCAPCAAAATTSYSPVVAQPTVAYAPATTYQTVQAQVPVTYYRPTTALSPVVGAPAMAGCTAVQVQVQRRAAWWDPLGLFTARGPINPNPINVQYQTTVAYPGTTALPGPAATVTAPTYAGPSYAAPATPGCANCAPSAPAFPAVPSVPLSPGTSLGAPPAATYPAPAGSSGGGMTVPADQAPTLNAAPQGGYQGSSYRPAPAQPITPPDFLAPSGLSHGANAAIPASEPPTSSGPSDLQLIPYPGAAEPNESSAPPLLNGRGKTASLKSEAPWEYSLIAWQPDSRPAPVAVEVRPAAPLDDGGWRAARSR